MLITRFTFSASMPRAVRSVEQWSSGGFWYWTVGMSPSQPSSWLVNNSVERLLIGLILPGLVLDCWHVNCGEAAAVEEVRGGLGDGGEVAEHEDLTNQRAGIRSRDSYWPIRGQYYLGVGERRLLDRVLLVLGGGGEQRVLKCLLPTLWGHHVLCPCLAIVLFVMRHQPRSLAASGASLRLEAPTSSWPGPSRSSEHSGAWRKTHITHCVLIPDSKE